METRAFRNALGWFPTGVTIIGARADDGRLVGVTANSFNSVSLDPPLVLFSLNKKAYSLPIFEGCGHYSVNILSEAQGELSNRFASAEPDKWRGVDYDTWETGAPILRGALASFDCVTQATHDGGDHMIFIGRVLKMQSEASGRPLVFCRGSYRALDDPDKVHAEPPPQPGFFLDGLEPWVSA